MSSRQPDNWYEGICPQGILEMLRSCLSLDGSDEDDDFDSDLPSDDESLPPAQGERVGYRAHQMEELHLLALRNLALRERTINSSSEGGIPAHHALGSEATAVCPACGYGPLNLASGSVSTLDLSMCEVGVGGGLESEPDDSEYDDDLESGPAPLVFSSTYPSDPSNCPEGEGEDDGDDLVLTPSSNQTDFSGSESAERTIHSTYRDDSDDDIHDDSHSGSPTAPFSIAIPLEQSQFDDDEETDSQVNSGFDVEHLQLPTAYWATQSTHPDSHAGEVLYSGTSSLYSNERSGVMELATLHPGFDEHYAGGEGNDEDDNDKTDNTYRELVISGKGSQENLVPQLLRQRRATKSPPPMSPLAHESSLGGFHRASPPSTIDPPAVATGRDFAKAAAKEAGTQTLGATALSSEPSLGIRRVFGTVKTTCRFFTADNFHSTDQSQQGGPAEDAVNVREKRIAPQLEPLVRGLPARVFRALPYGLREEETSGDHSSSDSLDETDDEGSESDGEGNDEGGYRGQGGWIIIGKERKKNI